MPRRNRHTDTFSIIDLLENHLDGTVLRRLLVNLQSVNNFTKKKLAHEVAKKYPSLRDFLFHPRLPISSVRNFCLRKGLRVSGTEKRHVLVHRLVGFIRNPEKARKSKKKKDKHAVSREVVGRGPQHSVRADDGSGRASVPLVFEREEARVRQGVPEPRSPEGDPERSRYSRFRRTRHPTPSP